LSDVPGETTTGGPRRANPIETRTDHIEAIVGCPPEKEKLVVQLFVKDGAGDQWGEIDQEHGCLEIEIFPHPEGRAWRSRLAELERSSS